MIKLAIFDLDGTLLNTLNDLADSCNYILEKNHLPLHTLESYKNFVGNGMTQLVERALPSELKSDLEVIEKIKNEFIEYYTKHSAIKTAPYDGVIEMLKSLSSMNIKLAVASNKFMEGAQELVKKYFSEIKFSSVLGQRTNVPMKPNPQIVYDIMKDLNVTNKEEIIYVGDTGTDMLTAVNAGITSIGVLWGFRSEEELKKQGAQYIINYPEKLLEIVNKYL
ncbi:HAD-IA family hydrolase [Apibacter sp. B3889]|uniref:HAD family hydrolase n=1 Tax=unclassified Apibacter TaxID=2630820 RepID=UPI001321499B|nr:MULTISPECIES: HAD family hydrolase [unclassified Apibacter]MXO34139.1 HAD-IA family hydrolase [Apibacter sp. B3883]MXO41730.1 HAD-IA family hydrolase [Apibacter sp. B3889]MXP03300.1 HAD-IA family hydrolase [Apibacter sp. B3887]MXP07437.1 HAD-IA family hydrolase [Apibacter sp. B3935]